MSRVESDLTALSPAELFPMKEEDVKAALSENLARFKHPKLIRFLDVLPRNVMGKVVHDDLRAALLGK